MTYVNNLVSIAGYSFLLLIGHGLMRGIASHFGIEIQATHLATTKDFILHAAILLVGTALFCYIKKEKKKEEESRLEKIENELAKIKREKQEILFKYIDIAKSLRILEKETEKSSHPPYSNPNPD